jgi:Glycosyl hydrolase family 12
MGYRPPRSLANILLGMVAAVVPLGIPATVPASSLARMTAPQPSRVHTTAAATGSATTTLCRQWQALRVTGTGGQHFVIRNKPSINHNDQGMCISNTGHGANFTVTRSPGVGSSWKVRAYPYIANGCFEGACAAGGEGPMPRAGSLGNYAISWATRTPPRSGVWNSSLDLWLGPRAGVGTSEIMIWLHYSKRSWWVGRYPSVWVDGARWYLVPHATAPGRHYLSFRRASPVSAATLRLAPFMAVAERRGYLSASAFLWCAQAGFEIFSGGKGLAITRFSIIR